MKTNLRTILALAFFCTVTFARGSEHPDAVVELDCPEILVTGMPCIITVSILNQRTIQFPLTVPKLDFTTEIDRGIALNLKFESESRPPISVGYPAYGRLGNDFPGPRPPSFAVNVGERVTYTYEINQLLFGNGSSEFQNIPSGKSLLSKIAGDETARPMKSGL